MAFEDLNVRLLRCDWCGCPGPFSPSAPAAVAEAVVIGWEVLHEVAACPACVERGACSEQPPDLAATCLAPAGVRFGLGEGV